MTKKILTSSIVIISLIAAAGGSAFAIFRDSELIPGNTISTGSVDISLNGNGSTQMPSPITASNLMPGDWSDWERVAVTNNSNTDIKLYFYVTDVGGEACGDTNLQLVTGPNGGNEMQYGVYNSNINSIKGIDNKVEITGYVFNPTMPTQQVAVVKMRAGLDSGASSSDMNRTCSWTGVFVAEPSVPTAPPVSFPTSFPESL